MAKLKNKLNYFLALVVPFVANNLTAQDAIENVSEEETVKDEGQDELENYSKGVQKRIATLTKKMREQERAAQSAYEYAKRIGVENQQLKTRSSSLDRSYL